MIQNQNEVPNNKDKNSEKNKRENPKELNLMKIIKPFSGNNNDLTNVLGNALKRFLN